MNTLKHIALSIEQLERFLIPSILLNDAEMARKVRPLVALSTLGFLLSIVYVIFWIILVPEYSERLIFPLLSIFLSALPLLLIRLKQVILARNLLLIGIWILLTTTMITAGGTRAPIFGLYVLLVMIAALLDSWRTAFIYASVTILMGFWIAIYDPAGVKFIPIATPLSAWLSHTTVIIIVTSAAYLILRQTQDALQNTHNALVELRKTQKSLSESEERFRLIASVTSDYTFFTNISSDEVLNYSFPTGPFTEISGYTPEEYIAAGGWRAIIHPDDFVKDDQSMMALRAKHSVVSELRIIRKDGAVRWVRVNALPIWDQEKDCLAAIAGGVRDITETITAEEAIRRSEAHLKALINATTDVAFLMSRDGRLMALNEALARPLGKNVADLIGKNAFDLLSPEVRTLRVLQLAEVARSGKPLRWEDNSATGVWDNSVYPIFSGDGVVEAFAVYSRDITQRILLEAEIQQYTHQLEQLVDERTNALRRANEQLELVLNNTKDALAFADSGGNILVTNPAFRATFQATNTQSIEFILWSLAREEQIEPVGAALIKVIYDNESGQVQAQILAKEGQERDMELTLVPIQNHADDSKNGILLHGHDNTQMKEIERFKARFVENALHDLATPISGLSTRLYLLQRSPEKLAEHVQALGNQLRHLKNLIEDLRTLSQMDRGQIVLQMETCSVNELVRRVFDIYEPVALEKQQSLLLQLDPSLPQINLDARQIERVLVNLVSNAVNYTSTNKVIRIETKQEENALAISVSDQGIGIKAEELPHIFERFYRTNEARSNLSSGTGLGLAITKEIIEMHGGSVRVLSEAAIGSTFTVTLPF